MHRIIILSAYGYIQVNHRVNYPLIRVLVDHGLLNIDDHAEQYCMSWFSIQVANVGMILLISSWNQHPIQSKLNVFDV